MIDLQVFAFTCAGGYIMLQGAKTAGTLLTLRKRSTQTPRPLPASWMREVAILQPILSGDPHLSRVLADNLATLPEAHFVWLLDEDDANGRAIADHLLAVNPQHRITTHMCGEAPDGVNPKTFKLAAVLPKIVEPVLAVLDDDARLSAGALAQMVGELEEATLVTGLPCYRDDGAAGARLMAQFVNNNAALTYLSLLPWMAPLSINGMCYVLRTERLRDLGGFAPLVGRLADDLALARSLRMQGAILYQSTARVELQTHIPSLRRYVHQMHRWFLFAILLLRTEPFAVRLLILVLHGLPPLLMAGMLVIVLVQPVGPSGLVAFSVLLLRTGVLSCLQHRLTGRVRHRPLLSLVAELLQPIHLVHAVLVRRIRWRTRLYQVRSNDDFHGS